MFFEMALLANFQFLSMYLHFIQDHAFQRLICLFTTCSSFLCVEGLVGFLTSASTASLSSDQWILDGVSYTIQWLNS